MTRKLLLLAVFIEAAALALWYGERRAAFDRVDYWLLLAGWAVFVVVAAVTSRNWRREEQSETAQGGFEVLPHEKK